MAVTTAVLSGTITDVIGDLNPALLGRVVLAIEANTEGSLLLDTSGDRLMAGAKRITVDSTTGAYSVTLIKTDSTDVIPSGGRLYRAYLQYPSGIPGAGNVKKYSGWFELTADGALSDADKWPGLEVTAVTQALVDSIGDMQADVETRHGEVMGVVATNEGIMTSVLGSGGTFDTELSATFVSLATPGQTLANPGALGSGSQGGRRLQFTDGVWTDAVAAGQSMSGFLSQHKNTGPGLFYLHQINTDSDYLDSGAGLAIFNSGKSDNIYLAVAGKSGATASAPTGLGVDLNRGAGSAENSTANTGVGVAIFDWSSTNQGHDGPRTVYLAKANNRNSDHKLLHLEANRAAVVADVQGGADTTKGVYRLVVDGDDTVARWELRAGGDAWHTNGRGIYLDMSSGNDAYMLSNGTILDFRGGAGGIRWLDTTGAIPNATLYDSGYFEARGGFGFMGDSYFDPGADLNFDGTTGTKIGTTATQKMGFYGATPVVRPTATPAAATDAATTQALVNDIRTKLIALGLIA